MLGLPSAGAGAWTFWSVIAISFTMIMMTLSGWLLLEALKHYEFKASFNTVTKDVLSNKINIINNLSLYFVGGILLYAYISTSGMLFSEMLGVTRELASVLFVTFCSAFVLHSTRAVDRISTVLILFMIISFVLGISGLASHISAPVLFAQGQGETPYSAYALALLPVALTSFGYHHSVSTMRDYYQDERRAKKAILVGTLIALTFYLGWVICIFGNLPREAFGPVVTAGGGVDVLMSALTAAIDSNSIKQALHIFSIAAIVSSFIGVGLGVFDYLADFFGFADTKQGRLKTWGGDVYSAIGVLANGTVWFCRCDWFSRCCCHNLDLYYSGDIGKNITSKSAGTRRFCGARGKCDDLCGDRVRGVLTAAFHLLAMANLLPVFKG